MGSSPSAPAKERGIGRASGLFLFLLLWVGGLEGETVQSGLPVDVRDRGRPSAQFARESNPVTYNKIPSAHVCPRYFQLIISRTIQQIINPDSTPTVIA